MKWIIIPSLFLTLSVLGLTGCSKNKPRRNISIMENKKSLINTWYGKDHFKPGVINKSDSLNRGSEQEDFESDAGTITIPTSSSNSHSPDQSDQEKSPSGQVASQFSDDQAQPPKQEDTLETLIEKEKIDQESVHTTHIKIHEEANELLEDDTDE